MKLGITLDDKLAQRMDNFADENYMSRSGLISIAVSQYLNAAEVSRAIQDLAFSVRKIADKGEIDEATLEQLRDFERVANLIRMK